MNADDKFFEELEATPLEEKKKNGREQQEDDNNSKEVIAVFNANTSEGSSMVRALASKGCQVVAIVRVFTSKQTQSLLNIKRVTVKVADAHSKEEVDGILARDGYGVTQVFLCLKYWERFDGETEEKQANMILRSCANNGIRSIVFSSFEDTKQLRQKGLKSQIVPDIHGRVQPKFEAMQNIKKEAKRLKVILTHMITSYLDQQTSQKSLCLIAGENGKLIIQPYIKDEQVL